MATVNDDSLRQSEGSIAQVNHNHAERALSILSFGFALASFVLVMSMRDYHRDQIRDIRAMHAEQMHDLKVELEKAQREVRVLQQISMDRDAVLLRAGLLQFNDSAAGPAYNIVYKPNSKH